jgi:hypothetical protein
LLVRIVNPITQSILIDEVPVQCKNYTGEVHDKQPIDYLERSIRKAEVESSLALLFIVGDLTEDFRNAVLARQEHLSRELGRNITFEIIDQDRIAELYVQYMVRTLQKATPEA